MYLMIVYCPWTHRFLKIVKYCHTLDLIHIIALKSTIHMYNVKFTTIFLLFLIIIMQTERTKKKPSMKIFKGASFWLIIVLLIFFIYYCANVKFPNFSLVVTSKLLWLFSPRLTKYLKLIYHIITTTPPWRWQRQ